MADSPRDNNYVPAALFEVDGAPGTVMPGQIDEATGRVLVDFGPAGTSPLTTKGDLYGYSTQDARIPVGTPGQVLSADPAEPTGVKWITVTGTGTVTSVAATVPTGLTVTGSPITAAGTLAFALDTGYVIPLQSTLDAKAPIDNPTFTTRINTPIVRATTAGGLLLQTNSGTNAALIGGGGSANFTSYGNFLLNAETASRVAILDASKVVRGADTATYPNLTELSYVKGVTSPIQTQLNAKGTGTVTSVAATVPTGLTITGSPVTSSGTLAITLTAGYVIPLQSTLNAKAPLASPTFTGTVTVPSTIVVGSNNFIRSGAHSLTLTTTATTNVTFPSGTQTLVGLTSTQTITNKTFTSPILNTPAISNPITTFTQEPASDDTYTGDIIGNINAGATITQWEAVYLDATPDWNLTDASAVATAGGVMLGLATEAGTASNPIDILIKGIARNDAWTWTVGGPIYLSETAGALTQTAPTTTDSVTRIVGYAVSDDAIYWNPSNDYITYV